ncbi:RAB11A [Mytilus coruscus]|uniref:RAB11A n=1 Tax=Mytilus coruscus TaxID=42192 RepID=A0A6J8BED9_MYTCO|nr:RAB11A [Mytilus coruscus]
MDRRRQNKQRYFSILVTGSSGCGKTSLINRFIKDTFNEEHVSTKFMDSMSHTVQINGKQIRVQLSDTDGDRNYEGYSINYYAEMDATIIIYDISKQESLENVADICQRWKRYNSFKTKHVAILVGNKSDTKREINKKDVEIFAEKENLPHTETSAKLNANVTEMFMSVIKRLTDNGDDDDDDNDDDGDNGNKSSNDDLALRKGYSSLLMHLDTVPTTTKKNSGCSCVIS